MDKFVDINLKDALCAVMKTNVADYKTDFNYDTAIMDCLARNSDQQDKTVLWLSHFSGINCDTERQIFMQQTEGNKNWCSFDGHTDERILAYAAVVKAIDESGVVTGDLYELDYHTHVGHVCDNSLPYNYEMKTIFFKDGYVNQVSAEDLIHILIYSREDVSYYRNEPEKPALLETLLRHEEETREQSYIIGNFDEHIRRLQDERIAFEAERIAAELEKQAEPNSPDKKGFMVKVSPYFIKFKTVRNIKKLIQAIPYNCVKICSMSGSMYAVVSAKEILKNRKPSILGQVKNKAASIPLSGKKDTQKKQSEPEV